MDISKTIDHIKIMIKMPNLSQEPPASFTTLNRDLRDMDVLCLLKLKIDSQNLVSKDKDVLVTSQIWIHIRMEDYNFSELNTDTTEAHTEIKLFKTKPKPNQNKN